MPEIEKSLEEVSVSALTIDVEDGISIAMRDNFKVTMPPTTRVLENVDIILNLLTKHGVRGTFFILGEVAESFPSLVKRIASSGHEIGIHGFHHDQVFRLTPQMFRKETIRAKELIESQIGHRVSGFRAPAFSINSGTSWAFDILAESGFSYDSSVFPSVSRRYGWNGFPKEICRVILRNSSSLVEVPLSVSKIMGMDFPVCGGGYLRYFPYSLTRRAFRAINKKRPVIVYMHPYELDIDKYPEYFYEERSKAQLKQKLLLTFYRFRKNTVKVKLENLIMEFSFAPLCEIISNLEKSQSLKEVKLK